MSQSEIPREDPLEEEAPAGLPWTRIVAGVAVLAGVVYLGRSAGEYVPLFAEYVESLGWLGPLVFIVGYAAAVVAFVPGSVLTLAAGAIFGIAEGTVLVFVAALLGSTAAFLIGRYLARARAEAWIAGDPRFESIDRAIGSQGLRIAVLLRLSPVFPFSLLNYGLGLTGISLRDYVIAGFGMLPGTLLYVYSGKVAGDVAAAAGGAGDKGLGESLLLGAGLLATVVVTVIVTRIARKALATKE